MSSFKVGFVFLLFSVPISSWASIIVECTAYQSEPNGQEVSVASGPIELEYKSGTALMDSTNSNQNGIDFIYKAVIQEDKFRFLVIQHKKSGVLTLSGRNGRASDLRLQLGNDNFRDVECTVQNKSADK